MVILDTPILKLHLFQEHNQCFFDFFKKSIDLLPKLHYFYMNIAKTATFG